MLLYRAIALTVLGQMPPAPPLPRVPCRPVLRACQPEAAREGRALASDEEVHPERNRAAAEGLATEK
jgi:hypothetical protein